LGDFRRKRNRALIPIFCRNQKDFHGNPKDIATAATTDEESALPDWFEAKNFNGIHPFQYINSIGIRSWETDLIYFSLYAAKAC
jgi:hypothetical protein